MAQQPKNQNIETAQNVGEAVSKVENFFKENRQHLPQYAISSEIMSLYAIFQKHAQ